MPRSPAPATNILTQWQTARQALLAEGWSLLDADEELNRRYPGLARQALLATNRSTSPGSGYIKEACMPTVKAHDDILHLVKSYQDAHGCAFQDALDAVMHQRPELWEAYRAAPPAVVKAAPRPEPPPDHWSLAKLKDLAEGLTLQSRTPLAVHEAMARVLATPQGQELRRAYYKAHPDHGVRG
jgi:hypothetical protein